MPAYIKDAKELAQFGLALDPDNPNQLIPVNRISGSQKFAGQDLAALIGIAQRRYGLIVQAEITLAVQFWHFGDVLQAIRKRHRYGRWLDFVKAQRWSYYRVSTALRIRHQHETPEGVDGRTVEEALGYDPRQYKDTDDPDTDDEELSQPKDNGGASTPQWLFDHCNQLAIDICGEPISLDVAAATWNHKCDRYFTEADDGRQRDWDAKAVWCNPPYKASIIEEFVRKAIDEVQHGTTSIFLVPWWNYPYMDLCEEQGRIHRICSPVSFQRKDGSAFAMNNRFNTTQLVVVVIGPTIRPGIGAPIRKGDPATEIAAKGEHRGMDDPVVSDDRGQRPPLPRLPPEESDRRHKATKLFQGDAVEMLKNIPDGIADVVLFDPPYPGIKRPYGVLAEEEWHDLMMGVLREGRRISKSPRGSMVVIIQPNYEIVGRMRLWPWKFVCWASEMWDDWGLIEDAYSFVPNALPNAGVQREYGLLRKAIKWCVWLGRPDCYRNQNAVLMEPADEAPPYRTDDRPAKYKGDACISRDSFRRTMNERGGVTPFNMLAIPTGTLNHGHPAITPYRLAEWWCRYLLPPGGVLVDPFCGSGTTLAAALDCGASQVIGIDKEESYLEMARRRIFGEQANQWVNGSG